MFPLRAWRLALALGSALSFAGCGYHFTASAPLAGDAGVERVFVPMFGNESLDVEAAALFTSALRRELVASGLELSDAAAADAAITGTIRGVRARASVLPVDGSPAIGEHLLEVRVDLTVVRSADGAVLWQVRGLRADHPYLAGDEVTAAEAGREAALAQVAERLMREARYRMFVGAAPR